MSFGLHAHVHLRQYHFTNVVFTYVLFRTHESLHEHKGFPGHHAKSPEASRPPTAKHTITKDTFTEDTIVEDTITEDTITEDMIAEDATYLQPRKAENDSPNHKQ